LRERQPTELDVTATELGSSDLPRRFWRRSCFPSRSGAIRASHTWTELYPEVRFSPFILQPSSLSSLSPFLYCCRFHRVAMPRICIHVRVNLFQGIGFLDGRQQQARTVGQTPTSGWLAAQTCVGIEQPDADS